MQLLRCGAGLALLDPAHAQPAGALRRLPGLRNFAGPVDEIDIARRHHVGDERAQRFRVVAVLLRRRHHVQLRHTGDLRCAAELSRAVLELEAQRGKHVSESAFALLYPNVTYLLSLR